jgi:hypothetical protein
MFYDAEDLAVAPRIITVRARPSEADVGSATVAPGDVLDQLFYNLREIVGIRFALPHKIQRDAHC